MPTLPCRFGSLAAVVATAAMTSCSSTRTAGHDGSAPAATGAPMVKNTAFLEQYAATRGFTHGTPKNISITPDGTSVLFLRSGPRSFVQDLFAVDTATGEEHVLLTADQILAGKEEKLTAEELARRERMRLASRGIASYALSKDGKKILVPLSGRLFVVDRASKLIGEMKSTAGYPIDPQFSPDATMIACVRDGDLYVIDLSTGKETRLTTKAGENITNGLAEFVAQEEMDRFHGFWWSPDSKSIAYEQADTTGMETFHIADPVSPDKAATEWPYPRPGRKNASVKLGVISAAGGATTWVEWNHAEYEYLAKVYWEEGQWLYLTVMNRAQTKMVLCMDSGENDAIALDLQSHGEILHDGPRISGTTMPIFGERDPAWVNLVPSVPHRAPAGHELLWVSEIGDELFLRAVSPMTSAERLVTPSNFGLQGLVGTNGRPDCVYVLASNDPTQSQVYRVSFGTVNPPVPEQLSTGVGVHGLVLSEKSEWCVQTSALVDGSSSWTIRSLASSSPGTPIKLTREAPPWIPNLELTTCGGRDFHAAIIRPRDFDKSRHYPVIVNVYGGPHALTVHCTPQSYYLQQWIADQGFIIVSIDGRGTPGRGRDWERAIKNDLIGPALEDQVDGLKSLGAKYPEMDLARVGIYGWSFGGYFSAMAAMQRPDVYKAGCAGAPVCDWLDYDTCYTERYLGVPALNADGQPQSDIYTKSSVLTYCKDLKVPLLIIHGTADDNVYFMHSLKMTQSLFRAGNNFEFLPLAGFTHMVPDPIVTTRLYSRIAQFFMEKLGAPANR